MCQIEQFQRRNTNAKPNSARGALRIYRGHSRGLCQLPLRRCSRVRSWVRRWSTGGLTDYTLDGKGEGGEAMTVVQVQKPNLTDEEIRYATKKLGREPNEGPLVLVGPGFDAGVVDLGNGWVATLHIESHNHPSAIDPYGGAATGVGGVVRDILSLGTRPIALLDPLKFGTIKSSHSR